MSLTTGALLEATVETGAQLDGVWLQLGHATITREGYLAFDVVRNADDLVPDTRAIRRKDHVGGRRLVQRVADAAGIRRVLPSVAFA